MAIWKLKPVDPREHHWRASTYVGPVVVRARDEAEARHLAASAFGISPKLDPDLEIPLLPWYIDRIVTCEHVAESDFDEEGPDTILGPEEALARERGSRARSA